VSIQAQILNLLRDLQERRGLTYLMISHDLAVVAAMSTRIGVLYLGSLMESGTRDEIVHSARHPYTGALIAAATGGADFVSARGDIPSPMQLPPGCPFQTRCASATSRCAAEKPEPRMISPTHRIACHYDLPPVGAKIQGIA